MTGNIEPGSTPASPVPIWRVAAMRRVVVISVFGFSSFALTLASLPSWAAAGGASTATAGLVTTTMLGFTVASQGFVPTAVTRCGLGPVLIVGLLALGLPAPLYALNQDLWWLLVVSAPRGIGFAVLTVLGSTMTARISPTAQLGEAIGVYGLAIAVPNLIAVPAGVALALAGNFGWVAVFAALPVLGIVFVPKLVQSVSTQRVATGSESHSSRAALIAVAAPSLTLLAVTLAGGGLITFLPIARPDGMVAAIALLLFGVTGAITRWRVGFLADTWGPRLLLPASLITAVAGLVVVAAGLLQGSRSQSVASVLVGAALFGAGYGATQNLTLLVAFARTSLDSVASAVWNVCFDAGTALGAFAVGVVAATGLGLPWTFIATALIMLIGIPLSWATTPPRVEHG